VSHRNLLYSFTVSGVAWRVLTCSDYLSHRSNIQLTDGDFIIVITTMVSVWLVLSLPQFWNTVLHHSLELTFECHFLSRWLTSFRSVCALCLTGQPTHIAESCLFIWMASREYTCMFQAYKMRIVFNSWADEIVCLVEMTLSSSHNLTSVHLKPKSSSRHYFVSGAPSTSRQLICTARLLWAFISNQNHSSLFHSRRPFICSLSWKNTFVL